jgi:hypothetical protein
MVTAQHGPDRQHRLESMKKKKEGRMLITSDQIPSAYGSSLIRRLEFMQPRHKL